MPRYSVLGFLNYDLPALAFKMLKSQAFCVGHKLERLSVRGVDVISVWLIEPSLG